MAGFTLATPGTSLSQWVEQLPLIIAEESPQGRLFLYVQSLEYYWMQGKRIR